MDWNILLGLFFLGVIVYCLLQIKRLWRKGHVAGQILKHFRNATPHQLAITERRFPHYMRGTVSAAVEQILREWSEIQDWMCLKKAHEEEPPSFNECLEVSLHQAPPRVVPPVYEDIDIGEDAPQAVLTDGFWLVERQGHPLAVMMVPYSDYQTGKGIRIEVATLADEAARKVSQEFLKQLEKSVQQATTYRGKVLSLESSERSFWGTAAAVKVHQLKSVERDTIILPSQTIELLERNVMQFIQQRPKLAQYRQSLKKGLLFYGPPGTGKSLTIQYLAGHLAEHTTLIITAEQVGYFAEYMQLARLLQPSLVVLEDVDLIARQREEIGSACGESLLNRLLNEMDGLAPDAEILFVLTTNRPEALEQALASRPGRVDQAIEFPLPDADGRERLIRLYAGDLAISPEVLRTMVLRTQGASAAFIKEFLRRSLQFHLVGASETELTLDSVNQALDELLFSGGTLNLKLLGVKPILEPEQT